MNIIQTDHSKPTVAWRLAKHNRQVVSVCSRGILLGATALGYSAAALAGPTGGVITCGDD